MFEQRKSIRKYTSDPVSEEDLKKILEAARVAPSAKNRQPWKFVVYRGEEKEGLLDAMEKGINRIHKAPIPKKAKRGLASADHTLEIMREAPVVIMVLNSRSKSPYGLSCAGWRVMEILDSLSIGAAIENMLLCATELGLGTLWIGNTMYAHKDMAKYMHTKDQIAGAVAVGHPNETPEGSPRKSFDEIVEWK